MHVQAVVGRDGVRVARAAADVRLHGDHGRDGADGLHHLFFRVQGHGQAQAHDGADAPVLVEDVHHAQARRRLALHHDIAAAVGQGRLHAQPQLPLVRLDQELRRAGDQFHARVGIVEPEHERVADEQDGGLVELDFIAGRR